MVRPNSLDYRTKSMAAGLADRLGSSTTKKVQVRVIPVARAFPARGRSVIMDPARTPCLTGPVADIDGDVDLEGRRIPDKTGLTELFAERIGR